MNPVYDFEGQVALVTDANSSIGLATAKAFAEAGAAVGELTSTGHREIDITCNVADEAQVAAMVKRAVAWPTHVPSEVSTCFFCRTGPRLALRKAKKNKSNIMSEHLEIHLKGMMHHMQHHVLYPFSFGKLNLPETSAFTAESVR